MMTQTKPGARNKLPLRKPPQTMLALRRIVYDNDFQPKDLAKDFPGKYDRWSPSAASTWNGQFDNLNFGSTGVALTWQGFTLGFNYIGGAVNGRMAARPTGGSTMNAFLVGAQYAFPSIPLMLGVAYESIDSQGAVAMTGISQRREYGIDVGGSYTDRKSVV